MQTLSEIKSLLESRALRPKRSLGQNFLTDHNMIRRLVDASAVGQGSLVLEVGPGTGTMTEELLDRGCTVIACELDDDLAAILRERIPAREQALGRDPSRFTLIHGDCLESKRSLNPAITRALAGRPFSLVSNLPYGAGTPLIATLLLHHTECASLNVTVQREVADRLLAHPRTKDYGPLSVVAQLACRAEKLATLPGGCFWPPPDVTSAMVRLARTLPGEDHTHLRAVSALCDILFAHRRKQLGAVFREHNKHAAQTTDSSDLSPRLPPLPAWESIQQALGDPIPPAIRAEELTPQQIASIARLWLPEGVS